MNLLHRRRVFFSLAFYLYLSFYLISPYCYTYECGDKPGPGYIDCSPLKHGGGNIKSVWLIVLEKIFWHEDGSKDGADTGIFIKKARVLKGTNNNTKIIYDVLEGPNFDVTGLLSKEYYILYSNLVVFSIKDLCYNIFSGLSPPVITS